MKNWILLLFATWTAFFACVGYLNMSDKSTDKDLKVWVRK